MTAADLPATEYAEFYAGYVQQVPPTISLRTALDDSEALLTDYLSSVAEERVDFAYAPGKWSVKQALQHLLDSERIFTYRILRLGRHDATPLPGFEQNDYALAADLSGRDFSRMVEEFRTLRKGTIALVSGLTAEDLEFRGTVSDHTMSCRAMAFILCGHTYHHHTIYRERYGL
ncbi:DinB family protein [Neolewinella sp.]|uniref:DinB family protein n=1 Tax=Neolewinella sp. TaxID=2993543 RepID=UPI003B52001B